MLGPLSALSFALSDLPWPAGLCLGGAALAVATARAWRSWRRPACVLAWQGGDAPLHCQRGGDGETWTGVGVHLRGPIAVLSARDGGGRRQHLAWWPDTLPAAARRQLRLALAVSSRSAKSPPPVAA